jgi:hypothetical protein
MKYISFIYCMIGVLALTGCDNEPAAITADCSMKGSGSGMCIFHNKGGEGAECVNVKVIAQLSDSVASGAKSFGAGGAIIEGNKMVVTDKEVCSGKLTNQEIIERRFTIPTSELEFCRLAPCNIKVETPVS